ncbi:MAG: hypothetical protein M3342_23450 [Bacteroidota bacterium]|nr:hypothetical protein [Bacteroidota bacterium]
MVKITELKPGDVVKVMDEGIEREGVVTDISRDDNMVCVDNGIQEFWYTPDQVLSIPLDEEQLLKLGFQRQEQDGGVKYLKGPFRVFTPEPGNFSKLEVWYREDRRRFHIPLTVHELQNHYLQMTKVQLERP